MRPGGGETRRRIKRGLGPISGIIAMVLAGCAFEGASEVDQLGTSSPGLDEPAEFDPANVEVVEPEQVLVVELPNGNSVAFLSVPADQELMIVEQGDAEAMIDMGAYVTSADLFLALVDEGTPVPSALAELNPGHPKLLLGRAKVARLDAPVRAKPALARELPSLSRSALDSIQVGPNETPAVARTSVICRDGGDDEFRTNYCMKENGNRDCDASQGSLHVGQSEDQKFRSHGTTAACNGEGEQRHFYWRATRPAKWIEIGRMGIDRGYIREATTYGAWPRYRRIEHMAYSGFVRAWSEFYN